MKIAVTFENGNIFQHFGRTEFFKVYDVENGEIISAEVIGSNGSGHSAQADLLAEHAVDMLICGGLGEEALSALEDAGILVFSGVQGDADEAVASFLRGELENAGATCDHESEEQSCCGGSCDCQGGGCGGCCSHSTMEGRNVGKTCRVHYRGTLNDGTQFDSSYDRGEPLEFVCGAGMMIRGFDAAVADMEVGQVLDIHLMPEEAYGLADPRAIFTVEIAQLPGSEDLTVGEGVYLYSSDGRPFPVKVTAKDDTTITFDANHELAGKELNFRVELVDVK